MVQAGSEERSATYGLNKGDCMELKTLALESGVEYIDKGNGHIQLKGALLVNYYPNSKSKSAYIAGTKRASKQVTPEEAIKMCFQLPVAIGEIVKRKGNSTRPLRAKMLSKGITQCYWCKTPLTLDTSTLEHIIPLARGGLDNANNRTLACDPCNQERGSNMPELTEANARI